MPLGDSITLGQNLEGGYRLPLRNLLAPKLDFTFVGSLTDNSDGLDRPDHEGHSGWRLIDFIGQGNFFVNGETPINPFVRQAKPDIILLLLGTNDGVIGQAEFERRYRTLLGYIYAIQPNVRIAFMEVLPRGDRSDLIAQSHAAAAVVAQEYQAGGKRIAVVDPSASIDPDTMLTDGTHPNATGYDVLARLFEPAIESLASDSTAKG